MTAAEARSTIAEVAKTNRDVDRHTQLNLWRDWLELLADDFTLDERTARSIQGVLDSVRKEEADRRLKFENEGGKAT